MEWESLVWILFLVLAPPFPPINGKRTTVGCSSPVSPEYLFGHAEEAGESLHSLSGLARPRQCPTAVGEAGKSTAAPRKKIKQQKKRPEQRRLTMYFLGHGRQNGRCGSKNHTPAPSVPINRQPLEHGSRFSFLGDRRDDKDPLRTRTRCTPCSSPRASRLAKTAVPDEWGGNVPFPRPLQVRRQRVEELQVASRWLLACRFGQEAVGRSMLCRRAWPHGEFPPPSGHEPDRKGGKGGPWNARPVAAFLSWFRQHFIYGLTQTGDGSGARADAAGRSRRRPCMVAISL